MKLTSDRLIRGIANQIDPYESSDALKILRYDYGFTDDEIHEMGFDHLFDLAGEPKPNEPPKKKYTVRIREVWTGTFEVEASDDDEAFELACDLEYDSADLNYSDRDVFVEEAE